MAAPGPTERTGRPSPSRAPNLEAIEVTVEDRHADDLIAVLARWHGRITDCPEPGSGALWRIWLYAPGTWPETRGMPGIPCADFPPQFRDELVARIAAEARHSRGSDPVRAVVIGFSMASPGGFNLRIQ